MILGTVGTKFRPSHGTKEYEYAAIISTAPAYPPTYGQLVEFWNAGHQNQQQSAIAGELLWATPEQAAAFEAPRGKAVVLFIRGTSEAHIKSHDSRTGEPTTTIIDYTQRPQVDNSPYATKEQFAALDGKLNDLIAFLRGKQSEEAAVNDQQP